MPRTLLLLAAATAAFALAAAGCGGAKVKTTTNAQGKTVVSCAGHVSFAKTKFLLHAGLAFGAFHRYILNPYRAGSFKQGAPARKKALAKAAAAALFSLHELNVARKDAICDGPTLRRLAGPLSSGIAALGTLRTLKTGGALGTIGLAGQALDQIDGQASAGGAKIKDINR